MDENFTDLSFQTMLRPNKLTMGLKILFLTVVLSAVIVISESERCDKMREYVREKRSKYYSSAPQRFYRRPPMTYPVKGPFSYTPPPSYANDNADPFPPSNRLQKVSKKPRNDGLGDEDIHNIVKYLSKQDLDKIIEVAYEKDKYNREVPFEYNNPPINNDRYTHKGVNVEQYKDVPFEYSNNPNGNFQMYKIVQGNTGQKSKPDFYSSSNNQKPYETEYDSPPPENVLPRIVNSNPNSIDSVNTPFDVQESMQHSQIDFFNKHIIQEDIRKPLYNDNREIYTDSNVMKEEILPRPVNLREDDYYGSFTHNVPSVVKADSSYKVENFGDLPLMNYNSKLDSVSSYHVPHYTITTPNKKPPTSYVTPSSTSYGVPSSSYGASSSSDVPLEPAPPASEAKSQSDAHLKATRIWTHKSKGTAYYLHKDGSLSLEKPKPYGP